MSRASKPERILSLAAVVAAVALAALAAAPGARAEGPIVLKFSHVVAVDTPKGRAAEFFKRRAEELTGGRVRVDVHPNSTLYKDREEIEALQLGAVQMLAPPLSTSAPLGVMEYAAFDPPFIFRGLPAWRTVPLG
jgi:C4-dicarboxylate-binding protein DctP